MLKTSLKYLDKETIEKYSELDGLGSQLFGDILLQSMNYNASCTMFCKCTKEKDTYNLGWSLENGNEYVKTFSVDELLNCLKDKILELSLCVKSL